MTSYRARTVVAGALLLLFLSSPLRAESQSALDWLERMVQAAQQTRYQGEFYYQYDERSETARITHDVRKGQASEYVEALDGQPRAVTRTRDRIYYWLPQRKLQIIEQQDTSVPTKFPALPVSDFKQLQRYYDLRLGPKERVAGRGSQSIHLIPRDAFRFARQFWADQDSGLLIKAYMYGSKGDVPVERFAFTNLIIGPEVSDADLQRVHETTPPSGWTQRRLHISAVDLPEQATLPLPGFRMLRALQRDIANGSRVSQLVYSDGLAMISVFIDKVRKGQPQGGSLANGSALNAYQYIQGAQRIIAMGDVPLVSLRRLAESIEAQ